MKRTLIISLFLVIAAAAVAQTPAAKQSAAKPAHTTVRAVPVVKAKPAPAKVTVVPLASSKAGSAAKKPVTVAVQPRPKPAARAVNVTPLSMKPAPKPPMKAAVPVRVNAAHEPHKEVAHRHSAEPFAATPKNAKAQAEEPRKEHSEKAAAVPAHSAVSVQVSKPGTEDKKPISRAITAAGRRDPFVSPVVAMGAVGSGCSTGKRCLTIDQVALKGIVKSEAGMIAVVVNAMDKAYFLRENDPVFNGYVVKITGDSIVFKETFHDKLGKPLTRDITKSISRPAA